MKSNDAIKYIIGCLAAVVFLSVAVWLVHSEGRRTRELIHNAAKETVPRCERPLTRL